MLTLPRATFRASRRPRSTRWYRHACARRPSRCRRMTSWVRTRSCVHRRARFRYGSATTAISHVAAAYVAALSSRPSLRFVGIAVDIDHPADLHVLPRAAPWTLRRYWKSSVSDPVRQPPNQLPCHVSGRHRHRGRLRRHVAGVPDRRLQPGSIGMAPITHETQQRFQRASHFGRRYSTFSGTRVHQRWIASSRSSSRRCSVGMRCVAPGGSLRNANRLVPKSWNRMISFQRPSMTESVVSTPHGCAARFRASARKLRGCIMHRPSPLVPNLVYGTELCVLARRIVAAIWACIDCTSRPNVRARHFLPWISNPSRRHATERQCARSTALANAADPVDRPRSSRSLISSLSTSRCRRCARTWEQARRNCNWLRRGLWHRIRRVADHRRPVRRHLRPQADVPVCRCRPALHWHRHYAAWHRARTYLDRRARAARLSPRRCWSRKCSPSSARNSPRESMRSPSGYTARRWDSPRSSRNCSAACLSP